MIEKRIVGIIIPSAFQSVHTINGGGSKFFVYDKGNQIVHFMAGDEIEISQFTPKFRRRFKIGNRKTVRAKFITSNTLVAEIGVYSRVTFCVENLNRRLKIRTKKIVPRDINRLFVGLNYKAENLINE